MLFSWLRTRRRRKLLAEPFPVRWEAILQKNVGHYPHLSPPEQARLRDVTRVLIAEKSWYGRGGLFVTEEMRVTVAAGAALLLLGDDHDFYPDVPLVNLYPEKLRTPVFEDGWEDDGLSESEADGQAVYRHAVLLSWPDVIAEMPDPGCGRNVVLHEFAHQLDFRDGIAGAAPPLGDRELMNRWRYVMGVAFADHRRAVAAGEETFFYDIAADNEAEFFADATEAFYCDPHGLRAEHPEVYRLLAAYYRVDPAGWLPEPSDNVE